MIHGPSNVKFVMICYPHSDTILEYQSDYDRTFFFFQQDSATATTAPNSMHCLCTVFGESVISRGLWPPLLPDLNWCHHIK